MKLEALSNDQLIALCPHLLNELKRQKIFRTNNLIGELGKHVAASE